MNSIKDRLSSFQEELPDHCTLVAVSKTKPKEDLLEAYEAGQRHFGENKVQELCAKEESLPKDIKWHMIGHLQRNKVKYIAPFVHLIHGVDTLKLLREINKQGQKSEKQIACLLQVHVASEETKFGFDEGEIKELVTSNMLEELPYVQVVGLMGMATNTSDEKIVASEFRGLKNLYGWVQQNTNNRNLAVSTLSMGMSGDYLVALQEGSNMIRVGSAIFGARN